MVYYVYESSWEDIELKKMLICLFVLIATLSGCGLSTAQRNPIELYNGRPLHIAVIGELPEVEREQVKFKSISFQELANTNSTSSSFDAVWIMNSQFDTADQERYVEVYTALNIPIFFIGTKKSYLPFVFEDMTYDDAPDIPNDYVAGYLQIDEEQFQFWGFELNDNEVTERNVLDAYMRIFTVISELQ